MYLFVVCMSHNFELFLIKYKINFYLTGGKSLAFFPTFDFETVSGLKSYLCCVYMSQVSSRQSLSALNHLYDKEKDVLCIFIYQCYQLPVLGVCVSGCWMEISFCQTSFNKVFYL